MASLGSTTPKELHISQQHWFEMLADVEWHSPQEACGLIAGIEDKCLQVFPISNTLQSPVRFRMEPREQLAVFERIDENDWTLIGIYHSHPTGPAHPSPTDIAEAAYPEAVNLIWFPKDDGWQCRGFIIREQKVHEIPIRISNIE